MSEWSDVFFIMPALTVTFLFTWAVYMETIDNIRMNKGQK